MKKHWRKLKPSEPTSSIRFVDELSINLEKSVDDATEQKAKNVHSSPLGPLEYVVCTPSAHRVHHGRNPYCIDRNYGGTLIIWDRLFGTDAEERSDERISYGLIDNVKTFNQIWLLWLSFDFLLREKWHARDENGKEHFPGLWNKLSAVFIPGGYLPRMKTRRFLCWRNLENNEEGITELRDNIRDHSKRRKAAINFQIDHSEPKYNPSVSMTLSMAWFDFSIQMSLLVFSAQAIGYHLDKHPRAISIDFARHLLIIAYLVTVFSPALLLMSMLGVPALAYLKCSVDSRDLHNHNE